MNGKEISLFDSYIIKSILTNNEFGIKQVYDLQSVKSMGLNRDQYPEIVDMIKNGQLELIEKLPLGINKFEFLEIMKFIDQEKNKYVVTVYDSLALEQDPQMIDIFRH